MKQIITPILIYFCFCSCQSIKSKADIRDETELIISRYSIPLTNNALNIYEGFSNFIFTGNKEVLFVASNYYTNNIDIFSLVNNFYIKSIPIPRSGPDAFYGVNTIALFNNTLYIDDGPFLHTIDFSTPKYTKHKTNEIIPFKSRNYYLTTSRFVANFDTGFKIDTITGIMYLPLFPAMRKSNSDYWNGKILCRAFLPEIKLQPIDIEYPDLFKEGNNYGELDRPQLLIVGDSLIYTFGCDPTIYVYNTKSKLSSQSGSFDNYGLKIIEPFASSNKTVYGNPMEHIDECGVYMPIKYSQWDNRFYRIRRPQKTEEESSNPNITTNILMVFDRDLKLLTQYRLPSNVHYNFHPTPNGLFFQEYKPDQLKDETLHYIIMVVP